MSLSWEQFGGIPDTAHELVQRIDQAREAKRVERSDLNRSTPSEVHREKQKSEKQYREPSEKQRQERLDYLTKRSKGAHPESEEMKNHPGRFRNPPKEGPPPEPPPQRKPPKR